MIGLVFINVKATMNEPFVDTSKTRPSTALESFKTATPRVSTETYKNGLATVYIEPLLKRDSNNHYYLYDIEPTESELNGNETYKYKGEITDPGLVYLIKNGYPNKSYTVVNSASYPNKTVEMNNYTITQLAIWIYNHEVWGMNYSKYDIVNNKSQNAFYADIVTKAKSLADAAKTVHNNEWDNGKRIIPSMSDPVTSSTSLKVVNNSYLLSEEVTVPTVMLDTYTVTADKGTIVDLNGNLKNTFNAGEKFKVKYTTPEEVTIKVTIKADNSYDHMYAYKNDSYQDHMDLLVTIIQNEKQNFTKNLTFTYSNNNKVRVSNKNSITNAEVAGATLVIKDQANKEVVSPWVTTKNPKEVTLDPGTYLLYQTIAADGYKLNEEPVRFTVLSDGSLASPLVMLNEPIKGLRIEYVDGNTGDPLPGANLVIKQNGNVINTITTKNTFSYITLEPGDYVLSEVKPAPGYANYNQDINFTVNSNGVTNKIQMDCYPLTGFYISLMEQGGKTNLAGATLAIERNDGTEVLTFETGEEKYRTYIQEGTYYLVERVAPNGYILSEEKIEFKVDRFGAVHEDIIMYNEPEVIPVPITGATRLVIVVIASVALIGCGVALLVKSKRIEV